MAGFALNLYAIGIVIAVVIVWFIAHRRRTARLPEHIVPVVAASRRRALMAIVCALSVFFALVVAGLTLPGLLGSPFAFASTLAGAAGLLLYALTPPRVAEVPAGAPRSAGLERRSWLSVIPKGWLHGFAEVGAVFVIVIVFCGLTADADDHGRSRGIGFGDEDVSSLATPYPGWFYGVPALVGLSVLAAAVVLALHRIGSAPAFPAPEDANADMQWRQASASVILKLAMGAMLFTLGGIMLMAGSVMSSAVIEDVTSVVWSVISDAMLIMGIVALVVSIVSVTLAALTAFTIGERLTRVPEPVR
ncbi:MAG: hypothetical protein BGN97_02825 [Microbacterium sp. 69-10]|uniref:hypothetical protein n=1 Tax=Microbacterium sp. 69-10 TaxID=1895783 RepID=UPI000966D654|nr:hypothetical protein [Microbacterium sp. 69-10]OJU40253.1 MAG: hypothetical protein BGN97_02825 [Microbacterium sp. 69-10]